MIPESIIIDGTPTQVGGGRGGRFLVIVDRQSVPLQPLCFRFFAILGIQFLLGDDDGWVRGSHLWYPADNVARYIYRLKQDVHDASVGLRGWSVVENDRQGRYRLIARPGSLAVSCTNLYEFDDFDLGRMVDKLVGTKNSVAE